MLSWELSFLGYNVFYFIFRTIVTFLILFGNKKKKKNQGWDTGAELLQK